MAKGLLGIIVYCISIASYGNSELCNSLLVQIASYKIPVGSHQRVSLAPEIAHRIFHNGKIGEAMRAPGLATVEGVKINLEDGSYVIVSARMVRAKTEKNIPIVLLSYVYEGRDSQGRAINGWSGEFISMAMKKEIYKIRDFKVRIVYEVSFAQDSGIEHILGEFSYDGEKIAGELNGSYPGQGLMIVVNKKKTGVNEFGFNGGIIRVEQGVFHQPRINELNKAQQGEVSNRLLELLNRLLLIGI